MDNLPKTIEGHIKSWLDSNPDLAGIVGVLPQQHVSPKEYCSQLTIYRHTELIRALEQTATGTYVLGETHFLVAPRPGLYKPKDMNVRIKKIEQGIGREADCFKWRYDALVGKTGLEVARLVYQRPEIVEWVVMKRSCKQVDSLQDAASDPREYQLTTSPIFDLRRDLVHLTHVWLFPDESLASKALAVGSKARNQRDNVTDALLGFDISKNDLANAAGLPFYMRWFYDVDTFLGLGDGPQAIDRSE